MEACLAGRLDNVKALIAAGAQVNAVNAGHASALHAAMNHKTDPIEITQYLLEKGADPNIADIYGFTPLSIALKRSKTKSAALLRTHDAIEGGTTANFSKDDTELQRAILKHDFALARKLVESGESVHETGRVTTLRPIILASGQTDIYRYSQELDSQIADFVQFLIDHGANPNSRDDSVSGGTFFTTALMPAVRAGLPLTVSRLVRAGADVNLVNSYNHGVYDLLREINFPVERRTAIEKALDEKPRRKSSPI